MGTYSRNTGGGSGAFQGHRLRGRPAKERKVALRLRCARRNEEDRAEERGGKPGGDEAAERPEGERHRGTATGASRGKWQKKRKKGRRPGIYMASQAIGGARRHASQACKEGGAWPPARFLAEGPKAPSPRFLPNVRPHSSGLGGIAHEYNPGTRKAKKRLSFLASPIASGRGSWEGRRRGLVLLSPFKLGPSSRPRRGSSESGAADACSVTELWPPRLRL